MRGTRVQRAGCARVLSLAALVLHGVLCASAHARNVALLVAVGQFHDPDLGGEPLPGTAADIESVQRMLSERWGFAPNDVLALRDQQATHDRVLAEISALEQRSAPGDTVLIYFSGHGTSANDHDNGFDLPYATGAWAPYDLDLSTVASAQRTLIIGRRDLVPRLKRLDQDGRWVVVVSDSCYSGQVVRSLSLTPSRSRYLRILTRDRVNRDLGVARADATENTSGDAGAAPHARPPPPPYPYQHVVLLSGASDSETGTDISTDPALQRWPTVDGRFHGAFTDAFLRLLDGQLLHGPFNYAEGRQAMGDFLERRSLAQHPQLLPAIAEDPLNVGSNPFLGMSASMLPAAGPTTTAATTTATAPLPARAAQVRIRLESVSDGLKAKVASLDGVSIVARDADFTLHQDGGKVRLIAPAGDPVLSTVVSDPKLIDRIAAQVWLNRSVPAGSNSLGLRAETDPGSRGNTYVQCETFVFEVRLEKPAYLMILDLDSQGRLSVLYPTSESERHLVASGAAKAIPGSAPSDRIVATAPFGTDEVTILAFEHLPGFLADQNGDQGFTADSSRAASLSRGLAGVTGAIGVQQLGVHVYPGSGVAGSGGASCGHS